MSASTYAKGRISPATAANEADVQIWPRIRYDPAGTRRGVLYLHGSAGNSLAVKALQGPGQPALFAKLANLGYPVIAPDLGASPWTNWTNAEHMARIEEAVRYVLGAQVANVTPGYLHMPTGSGLGGSAPHKPGFNLQSFSCRMAVKRAVWDDPCALMSKGVGNDYAYRIGIETLPNAPFNRYFFFQGANDGALNFAVLGGVSLTGIVTDGVGILLRVDVSAPRSSTGNYTLTFYTKPYVAAGSPQVLANLRSASGWTQQAVVSNPITYATNWLQNANPLYFPLNDDVDAFGMVLIDNESGQEVAAPDYTDRIPALTHLVGDSGNVWTRGGGATFVAPVQAGVGNLYKPGKLHLVGASMGHAGMVRFARDHPSMVASMTGIIPAYAMEAIRLNTSGAASNLTLRSQIDTAWGIAYPGPLPAFADPASFGAYVGEAGFPYWNFYASNDVQEFVDGAAVAATDLGGPSYNLGALGHTDVAIGSLDPNTLATFLAAAD